MVKYRTRSAVVVAAGLFFVTACAGKTSNSGDLPGDDLAVYYDQNIDWTPCDDEFQCGRMRVPLDYADPSGTVIEIALVRKPAADPANRLGSLVYNPGGPGGSGVESVSQASDAVFSPELHERYDLVGFDPRGVGASTAVTCLTDAENDAASQLDATPDSPAEISATREKTRAWLAACRENSPDGLIDHLSTVEVARDLDILRAVLDGETLDYLGVSYGSYLGAVYAEHFTDRVGRFVLDGAVDPAAWPFAPGFAATKARSFQVALDAFVADCVTLADCPLGADPIAAQRVLSDLVDRADSVPLSGDETRQVGQAIVQSGLAVALFSRDLWELLRVALAGALNEGDGAGLLYLNDLMNGRFDDGHYDSIGDVAILVDCTDGSGEFGSLEDIAAKMPELTSVSVIFGPMLGWSATCEGLPPAVGGPRTITASGAPPILVIGTTRDPATPYQWAQGLAAGLESGVLLTNDGDGHGAYSAFASQCVVDTVDSYLVDGAVPEDGRTCVAAM